MGEWVERRHSCNRIIGVERRGAPMDSLMGQPLPDPTRLVDEDFAAMAWVNGSNRAQEMRTGARNNEGEIPPGER